MTKKALLWIIVSISVICLSSFILFSIIKTGNSDPPIEQSAIQIAHQSADFNIYIPQNLPKNYKFNETLSSYSNNVLTYTVIDNKNQTITITQQEKPEQIDTESFSGLRFDTELGKASSLSDNNTLSTALITKDNVLILLTAQKTTNLDSIKAVINSLQKL